MDFIFHLSDAQVHSLNWFADQEECEQIDSIDLFMTPKNAIKYILTIALYGLFQKELFITSCNLVVFFQNCKLLHPKRF